MASLGTIERIAVGSIVIALIVLGLKFVAYRLTGSVALYSDALESVVNVATAIVAFVTVRIASRPADTNHPYGHYKAEYFSAVLEGVLIIIAALTIGREAYFAFAAGRPIMAPVEGLAVNVLASVINGGWAAFLMRAGRARQSPALLADARHLMTDVFSSVAVVVGVALASLTGWTILDPALAVFVAASILWSGWLLVRGSLSGLMDEAVRPDILERIRAMIAENATGAIEAHDLRTRHAGRATFLDFHLVVPGGMSVSQAHAICDRIEQALRKEIPQAIISIHVEPDDKAKHRGIVVL